MERLVDEGEVEGPVASRGEPTVTDRLPAVRIKKPSASNSQGNDPSAIKLDLAILTPIEWNGRRLVSRDA